MMGGALSDVGVWGVIPCHPAYLPGQEWGTLAAGVGAVVSPSTAVHCWAAARSGQVWQVFLHLNHHLLYTVTSTVVTTVYFLLLLLFPVNYSLSFDLFLLSFWKEGRLRGEGAGSIVLHFLYYEKFVAFFSVGVLKLGIPFLNHEKIRFSTISELSSEDDFFIN